MAEEFFFQWQNEVLRKTIYPRRDMKLADFLVYYEEIDLWAEYKNKDITAEVSSYHAQKKLAVEKAVKTYYECRNYFKNEDVRADYLKKFGAVDEEALTKIQAFHKTFSIIVPRFTNPRSETHFVSQQVLHWQQVRKDYLTRIASKQRRVDIMKSQVPPHPNVPKEEAQLSALRKAAFPMIDEELTRLYNFVSASSKVEKRKLELAKAVQEAGRNSQEARRKLAGIQVETARQEALQKKSSDDLARLKYPPDLASIESYFSSPDLSTQIRAKYPQASQTLLDSMNRFRKALKDQLSFSKTIPSRLNVVKNTHYNIGQYQKSIEKEILKHETDLRNMGPTWKFKAEREALRDNLRNINLKVVDWELDKIADFQSALEHASRSKEQTEKLIQAEVKELAGLNVKLSQLRQDAQTLQSQIDSYNEIQSISEEKHLSQYVPDPSKPVTVKDIVLMKVEEYKASLAEKSHFQLLELVFQRFKSQPERYPKWLQYMVIHFSGMRYSSAHGSWADPRDLLANLRILTIDKELKAMDDNAIEAFCREKLESYKPDGAAGGAPQPGKKSLAQTTDPEWKERIDQHVKRLNRAIGIDSPSHQRNALINLRTDESNYEIDALTPTEVYEALVSYQDELPDWMWKEIVKLTDLRVNMVNDPDWEKTSSAQQAQQFSQQDAELRQVLNDWKNKFVTGWREEHDRSDKLIVTRAVCNEVAEHIQHLRGHSPDGGLTTKPKWYQRNEQKNPQAYFIKPAAAGDLKSGASLLWLRFVRKEPNAWQVAHPISTKKGGHGLLPPTFTGKRPNVPGEKARWSYNLGDPITRSRTTVTGKGVGSRELEWLRWIHEATIVEVADTAEGTIVLTFETALPSDDPRLSSIGVFKHRLSDLLSDGDEEYYNRSYVGFVPEGAPPAENLQDMLDWNKILYKYKEAQK